MHAKRRIIDICPCLSLTFRDRNKIAEYLRKVAADPERHFPGWSLDQVRDRDNSQRVPQPPTEAFQTSIGKLGDTGIFHRCRVLNNGTTTVDFTMAVVISGKGRQKWLARETMAMIGRFEILGDVFNGDKTLKVFTCPHVELFEHVRSGQVRLEPCGATIHPPKFVSRTDGGGLSAIIYIYRPLGNRNWPADGLWARQCRVTLEV